MKGINIITCVLLLQQHSWLHAAPPIESCPHDSIQVEDICKCDPKLCSKPPCPYELNIAINGTDTPGKCCTIYSCEGCSNDTLLEGKCSCAPGAILNSNGECNCVDPHKSLLNNECICNPDLCELPQICDHNYVSVTERDGCCSKTKCIKCPDDSFATTNNDDAVEDKCVCYPCGDKECGPNEKVVIIQQGKDFPGSCCDIYRCENDGTEAECAVEGVVYSEGETWDTLDGQRCKCQGGISFCTKQSDDSFRSCHNEGNVYKHNEWWMLDSCTNCTCLNGEPKCIAHMCEVSQGHAKKPECQPLNCSKVCPDGYKLNKRGCKICKCNYPYKYDDILQKYNISKNQLKDILDNYFAGTKTASNSSTAPANISDEYQRSTPSNADDGCQPLMWSIVGLTAAILVVVIFCAALIFRNQRKKGSYDTNPTRSTMYERMVLTKGPHNNNNSSSENKNEHNIKGRV